MTYRIHKYSAGGDFRGMTLIELTAVIFALISLIMILLVGASAWKRGSDRAACIMNIRQVQVSVRSLSNMSGFRAGQDVSPVSLENHLIGPDKYIVSVPTCPADGGYTLGGDVIPQFGTLYMTCSLSASDRHQPEAFAAW
jgi:hypothetical protein